MKVLSMSMDNMSGKYLKKPENVEEMIFAQDYINGTQAQVEECKPWDREKVRETRDRRKISMNR